MAASLADIRDKDDAHPHGTSGWRTDYHAMRLALDAVLALHSAATIEGRAGNFQQCTYCSETGDPYCVPEGGDEWPCPTVRAIDEHVETGATA